MKLRIAQKKDAGQMLRIYAPFIRHNAVSFETSLPSLKEFEKRMTHYTRVFPWLVCESDNKVIGYAYASRYRDRVAYQWNCECSVYVNENFRRQGIARKLYSALFRILKLQGFVNVYAVITYPNPASIRFHQEFGFRKFAVYENVGYKLGKWHDVHWYALRLQKSHANPKVPENFLKLKNGSLVKELIRKHSA